MKTLANCNNGEFLSQMYKIISRIKGYADGIKLLKESAELAENKDAFSIISYICNDNFEETMEICGAMCFMTGKEFAELDPANGEDGITEIAKIFSSERCMNFFISALKLKKYYEML